MAARKTRKPKPKGPPPGSVRFVSKYGADLKDSDATIVGPAILDIERRYGNIQPKIVVAEAKNRRSPLYNYFPWDLQEAAEAFWLIRAKQLIRFVQIEYIPPKAKAPVRTRAFEYVRRLDKKGKANGSIVYVNKARIASNDEWIENCIQNVRRELESLKVRYQSAMSLRTFKKRLGPVFDEIDRFLNL